MARPQSPQAGPPDEPADPGVTGTAGDGGTTGDGGTSRLAVTVERLRDEVRRAQAAADGRALIDIAKGVFVERLQCGPSRAALEIARLADQAGISQLELAAEVVNQAARDQLGETIDRLLDDAPEPRISVRLRSAESGALAASDAQAAAQAMLRHALVPLGATGIAIWEANADTSLTLAGSAGHPEAEAQRWRYVPPGVTTPARRALTALRTVWFSDLAEHPLPTIGRTDNPTGGRVAVPAGTGGRVQGVLEISWPEPTAPRSPQVQRQIEALAELCAHTLQMHPSPGTGPSAEQSLAELTELVDGLHDSALVLLPHQDATGRLDDFRIHHLNPRFTDLAGRPRTAVAGTLFLETYPMAAEEAGLFEKLERVYATGEPYRAEHTTLTSLVGEVRITLSTSVSASRLGDALLLIWRVHDETARLAGLLQHAQRLGQLGGFEERVDTGEISWNDQTYALFGLPASAPPLPLRQLPTLAHPDDGQTLGRFLRTVYQHRRSGTASFRLVRGSVIRHIRVVAEPFLDDAERMVGVRGAFQDISAQHWTEVALDVTRDQLAHTAAESAERSRLALQLQQVIMPPTRHLAAADGLRLAVRYRPAESEHLVGGDWYDAVPLPSGRVLLCVGDVAGHGIKAATSMVVLRNALRGLAVTGAGPAQLLGWLNHVVFHLTSDVTATAICALYDPKDRVLRWAGAGHLPPVLVRGADAVPLDMRQGILLGATSDAQYAEHRTELRSRDRLLLYTDGLVERRDSSTDASLTQLISLDPEVPDLETYLDHLLTHSRSDTDDDTCVVAVQLS